MYPKCYCCSGKNFHDSLFLVLSAKVYFRIKIFSKRKPSNSTKFTSSAGNYRKMDKNIFFFLMLFYGKVSISVLLFDIFAQTSKKGAIFYTLVSSDSPSYNLNDDTTTHPAFTSPKLTAETIEQGVKFVQS